MDVLGSGFFSVALQNQEIVKIGIVKFLRCTFLKFILRKCWQYSWWKEKKKKVNFYVLTVYILNNPQLRYKYSYIQNCAHNDRLFLEITF